MLQSKKKPFIIILIAVIVVIVAVCALKKPIAYNNACKCFDSGDYTKAAREFDALDNYKDSKKKFDKSMVLALESQIDELISINPITACKPVKYYSILETCNKILNADYYSKVDVSLKEKLMNYYEYVQFLSYVFNYDSAHEFLEIDCEANPFFDVNLKAFYDKYYKNYEQRIWVATDKYNYFDELVTTHIEVKTNAVLKLKDDDKPYSDSNFEECIRLYVSFEGSKYDIFSESTTIPVQDLSNIQITTDQSNLSSYYDTAQYRREMGASNVAFLINFRKEPPTIKYAPDYIENQSIRTLQLKVEE